MTCSWRHLCFTCVLCVILTQFCRNYCSADSGTQIRKAGMGRCELEILQSSKSREDISERWTGIFTQTPTCGRTVLHMYDLLWMCWCRQLGFVFILCIQHAVICHITFFPHSCRTVLSILDFSLHFPFQSKIILSCCFYI